MTLKSFKLEKINLETYDLESVLLNLPVNSYPEIKISDELILFIYLSYHEKLSFSYIEHPAKKVHLHRYIDKVNEIIHLTGLLIISNKSTRVSKKVFKVYDEVYKEQILMRFDNNEEIRMEDICVLRNLTIVMSKTGDIDKLVTPADRDWNNYLSLIISIYYYFYSIYSDFIDGYTSINNWERLEVLLVKIFFDLPNYLRFSDYLGKVNKIGNAAATTRQSNQLKGIFNANLDKIALKVIKEYLSLEKEIEVFKIIETIMELDYNFINAYKKENNVKHRYYASYINLEFKVFKRMNPKLELTDRFREVYYCISVITLLYDSELGIFEWFNKFKEDVQLFKKDYLK